MAPLVDPAAFRRTGSRVRRRGAAHRHLGSRTPAPAVARAAPESLRRSRREVIDAVVNISAATTVDRAALLQHCRSFRRARPSRTFSTTSSTERARTAAARRQRRRPGPSAAPIRWAPGFVIDPSGIVVTNNHVIGDANDITVIFARRPQAQGGDRRQGREGRPRRAAREVRQAAARPSSSATATRLAIGDWVMAIGNPFGLGGSVTAGIVSARNRDINPTSPTTTTSRPTRPSTRAIPAARCSTWTAR